MGAPRAVGPLEMLRLLRSVSGPGIGSQASQRPYRDNVGSSNGGSVEGYRDRRMEAPGRGIGIIEWGPRRV